MKITIEVEEEIDTDDIPLVLEIVADAIRDGHVNEDTELMDGSHKIVTAFGNVYVDVAMEEEEVE